MSSSHHLSTGDVLRSRGVMVLLAILVMLPSSCVPSVRVQTSRDPSAVFENFETFAMIEPNRPIRSKNTDADPFLLQRLRQLAYLGLKERGLRPTDKSKADIIVGVIAATDEQVNVYSSGAHGYGPHGYGPYAYGSLDGPSSSYYVRTSELRIVVIELIDREKKSVLWRGVGEQEILAESIEGELREIVEGILEHYPVPSSKTVKP